MESWKRKVEILEAQCGSREGNRPKVSEHLMGCSASLTLMAVPVEHIVKVSLGRGLRRRGDMLYAARDLVEGE